METETSSGAPAAPSSNMRMIAVAATAIALLGISIPFVWQPHEDTPASTPATVTPAASHETTPAEEGASCMAYPKPANWDFKLKDLDGKEVSLASFKDQGQRCPAQLLGDVVRPVQGRDPGFVELQEKYRDKLTIIGYSVDDTAELAKKYAAEYKMNYPILLGEGREDVQDAYGPIWGIPRRSSSARTARCAASTWASRRKPSSKKSCRVD
jgi:hypothetical protein